MCPQSPTTGSPSNAKFKVDGALVLLPQWTVHDPTKLNRWQGLSTGVALPTYVRFSSLHLQWGVCALCHGIQKSIEIHFALPLSSYPQTDLIGRQEYWASTFRSERAPSGKNFLFLPDEARSERSVEAQYSCLPIKSMFNQFSTASKWLDWVAYFAAALPTTLVPPTIPSRTFSIQSVSSVISSQVEGLF